MINQLSKGLIPKIKEYFAQATKSFSKVSRSWAFTIIAASLAFFLKKEVCLPECGTLLVVMVLSIICIMLDGIQYFYTAAMMKKMLIITQNECKKRNNKRTPENSDEEIEQTIKTEMNQIHNNTYKIIIAKFCLLIVSSLLLITCVTCWYCVGYCQQ